jgi:hypothetical protein
MGGAEDEEQSTMSMSPDTEKEVLRINVKMISGIVSVLFAFVAGVAWGVRLEYRTEEIDRANVRQEVSIKELQMERADMRERAIGMERDLQYVKGGVEEIKAILKAAPPR